MGGGGADVELGRHRGQAGCGLPAARPFRMSDAALMETACGLSVGRWITGAWSARAPIEKESMSWRFCSARSWSSFRELPHAV
eukprot:scaffold23310_cov108-Isochrysis_galbana.AAC.3